MAETTNDFYVYRHIRLDTMQPFYIGKGRRRRAFSKSGRSVYWNGIVNKHGYRVDLISCDLQEEEAFEREKEFILLYGKINNGGLLCNFQMGGAGGVMGINKGAKRPDLSERNRLGHSEETKIKLSLSKKGKPSLLIGYKHTEETKRKNSESNKGRVSWNSGKKGVCYQLGHKKENHWNWGKDGHNRKPFTAISPKGRKHTFKCKNDMIKKHKELEKSDGNITLCLKNPTVRTCKGWSKFTYIGNDGK